jgi:hypothetical protein
LGGHSFISNVARVQAAALLRPELSVTGDGQVQDRLGRAPRELVDERMKSPDFAHFLKADATAGGVGAVRGADYGPTGGTPRPPVDLASLNLGQAALLQMQMNQAEERQRRNPGNLAPAMDMSVGFGLKRVAT